MCTLHRLITQAGGYADMERHVLELHDEVRVTANAEVVRRCHGSILRHNLDRRLRVVPSRRKIQ